MVLLFVSKRKLAGDYRDPLNGNILLLGDDEIRDYLGDNLYDALETSLLVNKNDVNLAAKKEKKKEEEK